MSSVEQGNISLSLEFFLEQKVSKDSKILELGCNAGSFSNAIYELGYENVQSMDINEKAIKTGKGLYPKIADRINVGDAQDLSKFKDASFDVVISFDVIEHLPNVDQHFSEVKRVLKRGGRYIFQTPHRLPNTVWEIMANKSLTSWRKEHCSLQTYGSLEKLAKKFQFDIKYLSKYKILNTYNTEKIKRRIGWFMLPAVQLIEKLPGRVSTNMWAIFEKN